MTLIEEKILMVQHQMIRDCLLWESTDSDRLMTQLTMYVCGINDMTETLLEELRKGG